jgi:hypothetical protein
MPLVNGQLLIGLPRRGIREVTLSATNRFQIGRDKLACTALDETHQFEGFGA